MPEHVVVVGAGFGGLWAARALRRAPVRVTVVDRRNHHVFQPLLYQVATAALNPSDIAEPIRRVLRRQRNAEVLLGDVIDIDVGARAVLLRDGARVSYDHLILATGATHSYFGHPEWERDAPGLKTLEDAIEIRRRVLVAFEAAERESDPLRRAAWLTFVIVGGGPTGVELAGAVAEIARGILRRDFRRIDSRDAEVLLLEAGPRLLAAYSAEMSESARLQLERLGCKVRLGQPVTRITPGGVATEDTFIAARTVLWAAGVQASPLAAALGAPLDRAGRVRVDPDLSVPGHPEIRVVGDLAAVGGAGGLVPGVAPAAMQMGEYAAGSILRGLEGRPSSPFRYRDKGSLATIGKAHAVAERGKVRFTGWVAWMMWLLVHIFFLIGFRNRFLVLAQWAWVYVRNDRGARLITGDVERLLERAPVPSAAVEGGPAARAARDTVR